MPADTQIGYIVDDEPAVRRAVSLLLTSAGYSAPAFESGEAFLRAADQGLAFGCVLLDMRMPGMDGLAVQREMTARRMSHPVIVISAHADVALAVQAMKAGACDFIEKPFSGDALLRATQAALERGSATQEEARLVEEASARLATLSRREAEVLEGLVAGKQNKVIALDLGISPRTVEIHRSNLMTKLNAESLSAAVRMALAAGRNPSGGRTLAS